MTTINRVELCGAVIKPPKVQVSKTGVKYCTFTLEIPSDSGTDFPNCVAYKDMVDVVCKAARRGMLHICGVLRTYHPRVDGVKRTEVLISQVVKD